MKRHPFALAFSERRMAQPGSNLRRAPIPPKKKVAGETDEVLEFRAGQILRLLEVSGERGQTVYSLMQATELDAQGVLDAVRILQRGNIAIRPELDYERDLELLFILETKLPDIGGGR